MIVSSSEPGWYANLEVGFYFGARYQPEHVASVVSAVLPWLVPGPLSVQYEDIPLPRITHRQVSEHFIGSSPPISLRPDSVEFRRLLDTKYVSYLRSNLRDEGRPLTVWNLVSPDDTLTVKVMVALQGRESPEPVSKLIRILGGEGPLFSALNRVDPLWATLGVETHFPVLGELVDGVGGLPDCGYYGSRLVDLIGLNELRRSLRGCPMQKFLPGGGVFFCWLWSRNARETEEYKSFRVSELSWRARVLGALQRGQKAS